MRFFIVDTMALDEPDAEEFAFVDQGLDELGAGSYMPSEGDPMEPLRASSLTLRLRPGSGVKLGALIGNTHSYLLLATAAKECVERRCAGQRIEYVPFTLYNRKNRVHSDDYFVVNPIGTFDCINRQASDISYFSSPNSPADGSILEIRRLVLDAARLQNAPALFRIGGQPRTYVVNEALAADFAAHKLSNIPLVEVQVG